MAFRPGDAKWHDLTEGCCHVPQNEMRTGAWKEQLFGYGQAAKRIVNSRFDSCAEKIEKENRRKVLKKRCFLDMIENSAKKQRQSWQKDSVNQRKHRCAYE